MQSCCGRLPGNGCAVCNSRTLVLVCACVCRQAWLYSYINALASDHTACHKHSDSLPQSAVPPTSTTPIAWSFSNNCSCNKRHQHQYRNGNETALHCIALAAATCCQLFVHYTFATTPKAQAKRLADGLTVSLAVKLYVQRIFAAAWTRMWTNICGNFVVRLRRGVRLWQEEEICKHFQIACRAAARSAMRVARRCAANLLLQQMKWQLYGLPRG